MSFICYNKHNAMSLTQLVLTLSAVTVRSTAECSSGPCDVSSNL